MMIYVLAAGMTLTMLIATAVTLREEAANARLLEKARQRNPFDPR
jgi:hypothetical protein